MCVGITEANTRSLPCIQLFPLVVLHIHLAMNPEDRQVVDSKHRFVPALRWCLPLDHLCGRQIANVHCFRKGLLPNVIGTFIFYLIAWGLFSTILFVLSPTPFRCGLYGSVFSKKITRCISYFKIHWNPYSTPIPHLRCFSLSPVCPLAYSKKSRTRYSPSYLRSGK